MILHTKSIARILGHLMIITGLAMTVPLILAAIGGNPQIILGFLIPAAFSLALGGGLSLSYRDAPRSITMKDGMFLTVLSWVLISCFGAMPYLLTGVTHSPISALFESISSYTTTGATILTNVSGLPRSILFWRSFSQWLGGIGILVLLHIFPIGKAFTLDIRKNLGKSGHGIDVLLGLAGGLIGEGTTADTIDGPLCGGIAVGIESLEVHAVGMEGKHLVGLPDDFYRDGCRTVLQGLVGAVAAASGGKTAVEGDTDGMSLRVVGLELKGSSMGCHGVATGGSVAFAIDFLYCFHVMAENLRR